MTVFLTYMRLRIKAVMKIFPAMCVMTLLLCLSLGGMLYMQSERAEALTEGEEDTRLSLGVVGVNSSGYLTTLFPLLKNMDPSSEEADFITFKDRESAADAIRSGKIYAAILIPDGLVDSLLAGETGRMTLLFPAVGAGIETLMVRELSVSVSSIISSMESGSLALEQFCLSSGITDWDVIAGHQTDLLLKTLQDLLHRGRLFQVKYVRTSEQVSIESFYLIAMVLLLYLMLGIMCAGSYIRSDDSLTGLLKIRGVRPLNQVLAEWVSLLSLLGCICALFLPLIGFALCRMPITFSAFGVTDPVFMKHFLLFGLRSIPVLLLAASIDLMIYEFSPNLITGVLMQFLAMISLAYASGVFYTARTMPAALRSVSGILPTGQALVYLQKTSRMDPAAVRRLVPVLLWTILFLVITALRRTRRIASKGGA